MRKLMLFIAFSIVLGIFIKFSLITPPAYADCSGIFECGSPVYSCYDPVQDISGCNQNADPDCSCTQTSCQSSTNEKSCASASSSICYENRCSAGCTVLNTCSWSSSSSGGCTSDLDCGGTTSCQACNTSTGQCYDANKYCSSGQYCSGGRCYTSATPTPTPVPACQCSYSQSCTTSINTSGNQTCRGKYSGSTCVWDSSGACSPNCGTCVGYCQCTYTQSCTTGSGQPGTQTCSGSKNSSGACVWDSTGGCSPNCSTCTASSSPTSTPTPTPKPAGTCTTSCGLWYCDKPNTCNGGANYQLAQQCSNSSTGSTCYNTKCDPNQCPVSTPATPTPTPQGSGGSCSASYSVSPSNPSANTSVTITVNSSSNNFSCVGGFLDGGNVGCSSNGGAGQYKCTMSSGSNGTHTFQIRFGQSQLYPVGTSCGAALSCNSTSFTTGSGSTAPTPTPTKAPTPTPIPRCITGTSCGACSLQCTLPGQTGTKQCVYTAIPGGGICQTAPAPSQSCTQSCSSGYDCNPSNNLCQLDVSGTVYDDTNLTTYAGAQVVISVPTLTPSPTPTPTPTPTAGPTPTPTPTPRFGFGFTYCDSSPTCSGACSAPANSCNEGNGTQLCTYTKLSTCTGFFCTCFPKYFTQSCTANACQSPLICNSGICSGSTSTNGSGQYKLWFLPGTYNLLVKLGVPVGYVANSQNPVSVDMPPSQHNVDFRIKKGTPITVTGANDGTTIGTGGLILDSNSNGKCDADDTNYSGGATLVLSSGSSSNTTNSKSDGSFQVTTNLDGSTAHLTISFPLGSGYKVIGMREHGVGDCTKSTYTPGVGFTLSFPPNNQNIDILIGFSNPWWQVDSGDVRRGIFNDFTIPTGQKSSVSTGVMPLFFSTNTSVDLGTNDGSAGSVWKADSEYFSYNHQSISANGAASYSYYLSTAKSNGIDEQELCAGIQSNCSINITSTGVYFVSGDTTVTNYAQANNTRAVILANDDLTIKTPITPGSSTDNTLTILAARGSIHIDPDVGNTTVTDASTDIRAVLTSEKSIIIKKDPAFDCGSNPSKRLVVEGSLIANALHPFANSGTGKVIDQRSLCGGNTTQPTLLVKQRIGFLTSLTDFYKLSVSKWSEIRP